MSKPEILLVYGYPLFLVLVGALATWWQRSSVRRSRIRASRQAARADEKILSEEDYERMIAGVDPPIYQGRGRKSG